MNCQTFTVPVTHRKRVKLANGGFTTESLPDTQETVRIEVDFERLAKMYGPRAALSKGGRAVEAKGCVSIKHVR